MKRKSVTAPGRHDATGPTGRKLVAKKSAIVIDPKGQLAAMTADHRRARGDVMVFDPFGTGMFGFNPLAHLDPVSMSFHDDAAAPGEAPINQGQKSPRRRTMKN